MIILEYNISFFEEKILLKKSFYRFKSVQFFKKYFNLIQNYQDLSFFK